MDNIEGGIAMKKLHNLLNQQVADLNVFFVKLHHYHWFVKGPQFYTLHEKFEEIYDEVNSLFDEYAERLITVGGTPASSLSEYLSLTTLTEASETATKDMLNAIISDLTVLVDTNNTIIKVAGALDDEVTVDLAVATNASLEKHRWMLNFTNS